LKIAQVGDDINKVVSKMEALFQTPLTLSWLEWISTFLPNNLIYTESVGHWLGWSSILWSLNLTLWLAINDVMLRSLMQGVPGVKVTTLGVTSLADAESKTSHTHGSNSQRFRSYEVWKKLERKDEHCAFIEKYSYRFVVQHSSKLFEVSSICFDTFSD
jgi:hypothetical protein